MDSPIILDISKSTDKRQLNDLVKKNVNILDHYDLQVRELFEIRYPGLIGNVDAFNNFKQEREFSLGKHIYYPWKNQIIKILDTDEFYELRTARNNPLFSPKTQAKLRELKIGIAGLSVGSNIVRGLVYAGIGRRFKIADPDVLETSNLNRISGNLLDLGKNKTEIMARQIWEIDPYIEIVQYNHGIIGTNLENFLSESFKLDAIFDEVDDISLKIYLKIAARASKLSYFMVTDNGYSAELDVCRFDLKEENQELQDFPHFSMKEVADTLSYIEKVVLTPVEEQKLIDTLIGSENRAEEMKIAGKLRLANKIKGWPQLQSVAGIGAGMAVYALKLMVEGKLKSVKKVISLE